MVVESYFFSLFFFGCRFIQRVVSSALSTVHRRAVAEGELLPLSLSNMVLRRFGLMLVVSSTPTRIEKGRTTAVTSCQHRISSKNGKAQRRCVPGEKWSCCTNEAFKIPFAPLYLQQPPAATACSIVLMIPEAAAASETRY